MRRWRKRRSGSERAELEGSAVVRESIRGAVASAKEVGAGGVQEVGWLAIARFGSTMGDAATSLRRACRSAMRAEFVASAVGAVAC